MSEQTKWTHTQQENWVVAMLKLYIYTFIHFYCRVKCEHITGFCNISIAMINIQPTTFIDRAYGWLFEQRSNKEFPILKWQNKTAHENDLARYFTED